jgi:hypothetical protein
MDLGEIVCDGMGWIDLAQAKGSCEHGNELSGSNTMVENSRVVAKMAASQKVVS